MINYEIIFLVNTEKSEILYNIIKNYSALIKNNKGKIHRLEDWGRRQLAYPIKNIYKANYILLNIEVKNKVIKELKNDFRFNDYIIRSMIIRVKKPIFESSPIMKQKEKRQDKRENFIKNSNKYNDNLNTE